MILVKIHKSRDSIIVCLCDSNLINKKFSDGKLSLDVSKRFYGGESVDKEKLSNIIKEGCNLNIVGKESVELALKCNKIHKENIIKIKNIPHAIFIR